MPMNKLPELKPTRYDALVAAVVLLLAAALGAYQWRGASADALSVVVRADGAELERFPLGETERRYTNNGYTLTLAATAEGVCVSQADCPTRDCVRTGTVTRAGQSIVCLPARIVVTLEGAADAPYDAVAG